MFDFLTKFIMDGWNREKPQKNIKKSSVSHKNQQIVKSYRGWNKRKLVYGLKRASELRVFSYGTIYMQKKIQNDMKPYRNVPNIARNCMTTSI